jgi:type II secretory ATPase GspE/PulE/Tfp pilus assembly ATPase PilB-like protein
MLGFSEGDEAKITKALAASSGMILATGPTGSGKTTTLYTLIQLLKARERALVTIEDPIEYAMEGVRQIQVNTRAGLTFSNGLRTILRQDPDVIMVGEIRDLETASIAVNTALSGHLLLSTLHTNDAVTAVPRLLDMKVEPFLVASTISLVIAQRLVRMRCEFCKEKTQKESELSWKNKGCEACSDSGYKGRFGINEIIEIDEELRQALLTRASARDLKRIAVAKGMRTMYEDGLEKARSGVTSLEEVLRVIHE